jgi:PAS domain-containing protein
LPALFPDITPVEPSAPASSEWDDARAQMLLDTWLLALFAALLATALPWFLSSANINFLAASWVLLLLGADYVALSAVSNLTTRGSGLHRRGLTALHVLGVIGLGLLWQRCGGLQNPAFLLAFILPVIGGSALSRWQPYLSAALALLVVAAVALVQAPELRWYAPSLQTLGRWLNGLSAAGSASADAQSAFPGFYAPVGYDLVLLEVFGVLVFFCAVAAESLGDVFEKVLDHLRAARTEATQAQELWSTLMVQLPLPALLVDCETLTVVLASRQLAPFWPAGQDPTGQALTAALHCAYPEQLQELIVGAGGVATPVVMRVGEERVIATVRVQHLPYEGRRLALLVLENSTDTFQLQAALDAQEQAALVISARGRVVAANKAAAALFPDARPGEDAGRLLSRSSGVQRWWEPGLTGRRRMHVTLGQRTFLTTCTAVALPGEEEALFVLSFSALLPATAANEPLASAVR